MGPLAGLRVLELAGVGPSPMTGMMLADMGAEVIRVDRGQESIPAAGKDPSFRNKKSVVLNLKTKAGVEAFLKIAETCDVVMEGYRPGVVEKLGVGPEDCWKRNPGIIYARMTGWGQTGPLSPRAGHDINYISLTGALHAIGREGEKPVPPLNLIGDMAGGGMLMAFGIMSAVYERQSSGKGQVIDAAMLDGSALLMWMTHGNVATGHWDAETRGVNFLDSGAPYYEVYETKDGKYISVGPFEPQFYKVLLEEVGMDTKLVESQYDSGNWRELKREFEALFKTKTRDEWCDLLEHLDACFTPVLSINEAPHHPHNQARNVYSKVDGYWQPSPAPRFSRTPGSIRHGARDLGADTQDVLAGVGMSEQEIESLSA